MHSRQSSTDIVLGPVLLDRTGSVEELDEALIRGSPGLDSLMVTLTKSLRKNDMMLHGVEPPTNPLEIEVTLVTKKEEKPSDCSSVRTRL